MGLTHRTEISAKQLEGVAKHIEEVAAEIRSQAAIVTEEGFAPFHVTAWGQTERGLGFLDSFLSAIRDSLLFERQERGDIPRAKKPAAAKNGAAKPKKLAKGEKGGGEK